MGISKGPKVPKKVYAAISLYDGGVYLFTEVKARKSFIADSAGEESFKKATYVQEVK